MVDCHTNLFLKLYGSSIQKTVFELKICSKPGKSCYTSRYNTMYHVKGCENRTRETRHTCRRRPTSTPCRRTALPFLLSHTSRLLDLCLLDIPGKPVLAGRPTARAEQATTTKRQSRLVGTKSKSSLDLALTRSVTVHLLRKTPTLPSPTIFLY